MGKLPNQILIKSPKNCPQITEIKLNPQRFNLADAKKIHEWSGRLIKYYEEKL